MLTNLKGEIDSNTIIVGDFNNPLKSMDRSSRQKINMATLVLNDMLDQMDLTDIYRTFHPKATEYILLMCMYILLYLFFKIDNMLGHRISQ